MRVGDRPKGYKNEEDNCHCIGFRSNRCQQSAGRGSVVVMLGDRRRATLISAPCTTCRRHASTISPVGWFVRSARKSGSVRLRRCSSLLRARAIRRQRPNLFFTGCGDIGARVAYHTRFHRHEQKQSTATSGRAHDLDPRVSPGVRRVDESLLMSTTSPMAGRRPQRSGWRPQRGIDPRSVARSSRSELTNRNRRDAFQ